jgi:hypothetical protein
MNNNQRSVVCAGAVFAGLLATAFLPMAIAVADNYDFTPDSSTLNPTQVEGYPPLDNVITGTEKWNLFDLTTNANILGGGDVLSGTDTVTTIGSFTNDDFLYQNAAGGLDIGVGSYLPTDSQIDLANFGGGFENEWIDMPSNGSDPGVSDLLITPFGDFQLLGTAFDTLSTALG